MKTTIAFLVLTLLAAGSTLAGPIDQDVDRVLVEYFKIQRVLAQDSTQGTVDAARQIADLAAKIKADGPAAKMAADLKAAAEQFTAPDLKTARDQFFALSKPLLEYLHQHYSGGGEYFRFYCGMARKAWVQEDEGIRNPYHGSEMLTCGERIG